MSKLPKGFTLLELIITLAVAGILMGLAAPSFTTIIKNNRLIAHNNELLTALSLAKSEALKRGQSVSVCKRNIAGNACDSTKTWSDGWLVFSDQDGDGVVDGGDNDEIIRVYDSLTNNITLSYSLNQVTFSGLGFSEGYSGAFKFCDDRSASYARGLILANTGQINQAEDSNTDGIKEDDSGTNFSCP